MKDKLQLEEVLPYLPYDVQYSVCNSMGTLHFINIELTNVKSIIKAVNKGIYGGEYKLVLKPLSDLTEKYVSKKLLEMISNCSNKDLKECIPYSSLRYLLKLHFDVFNLIGRGLAVDEKTIK